MLKKVLAATLLITAFQGCSTAPPSGLTAVSGFDAERYTGKWFEIARLDHFFERGLSNVTAQYTKKPDGQITVLNRGYKEATGKWQDIEGNARFLGDPSVGSLEVKVGAPFYGGYHIIALDKKNYQYALVSGPNRSYLWLLARSPKLDPAIQEQLVAQAKAAGFDTASLIFVTHDRS